MIAVLVWASAPFGAARQYLGSLSAPTWATEVSLLSAPWLLLPFLAGCTQRSRERAALLGFAVTLAGLVGYGLMTLGPIEGAQLSVQTAVPFCAVRPRCSSAASLLDRCSAGSDGGGARSGL